METLPWGLPESFNNFFIKLWEATTILRVSIKTGNLGYRVLLVTMHAIKGRILQNNVDCLIG